MNALDSRIRELVAYARERDGEDRTNLFRNLIDLFLTGKAPTINPTRDQLLDVLEALIPHVEADSRRTACELVAAMSAPPMDLVMRLARDRASLVNSLLMHTSFDEDDLIELIERTGREHHQVIASRDDLSANVWISLARAAPAAPPFDHQSTLALWSDDLGITQTKAAESIDAAANTPTHLGGNHAGATVTPLHPNKAGAAIRILRTDEDLIAARMKGTGPTGLVDENGDINEVSSMAKDTPKDEPTEKETSDSKSETGETTSTKAKDPGPGGWAWVSDRDGFVISISPQGLKILEEDNLAEGFSVLDLLGLNSKLDHPVARAFQRRSAIHDAPIYLKELDENHRHWTLEATPYFTNGGIFEGYEGILTPVVPASLQQEDTLVSDDVEAVFLDEVTVASTSGGRSVPLSYTDTASVFATPSDKMPHSVETEIFGTSAEDAAVAQAGDIIGNSMSDTAEELADEIPLHKNDADKLFSSATASAIRGVIEETLTGVSKSKGKKADPEADESETQAHLTATLDMLEETIAKMMIAGKKAHDPQIRLYGEIASACVRSLKEQITE